MASEFEPIAILGMGMRLPGAVRDASSYWQFLREGRSGHCRVPPSRYNAKAWYSHAGKMNHVATQHGYFLEEVDLASNIDLGFWSMGKQEAAMLEPGARLLLEVVYEAFESSGAVESDWRGSPTGVYIGTMGNDWTAMEQRDAQNPLPVRADVYGDYILANRISYEFDLEGPSVVVRTACSSSLVALHQACQDLQRGICSAAIVGGVNIILSPRETAVMSEQGVLSRSGLCKTFDADADGYGRGEGVTAVYIKRLADALRDGDPIRSVIRSAVVSNDGKTDGMLVPDPRAHERLIRTAYRVGGIRDEDVPKTAMVECHGTGTAVGDPLEASAVANIWGESGIFIGSVKPNIGHGEGSSGISSLIKMTLALENATIPPNINFKKPNLLIPFAERKLTVPTSAMAWPEDRDERVSINSFGIGGTNAHVILESAACAGVPSVVLGSDDDQETRDAAKPRLLIFSTKRQDSVVQSVEGVKKYIEKFPDRLPDVAYTLSNRRTTHPWRAFGISNSNGTCGSLLELSPTSMIAADKKFRSCWVFTGQGAQWAQMGKELIGHEPLVSKCVDELDEVLRGLPEPPPWTIREEIMKSKDTSRLYEAEISQPCLAAIQIAIVQLLWSWGCRPAAIVGHSSGETAAAYAAGAITAEQAIVLNYHRGQITPGIKAAHRGSMAAVGLSEAEVQRFLQPGLIVGCVNSTQNVTLSGDADVLQRVMANIQEALPGILVRALRVECGFHSQHMQTAAPEFARRISGLTGVMMPKIPFYSSISGDLHDDLAAPYWIANLTSPVCFSHAVQSLLRDTQNPIFVEIGPHSALLGPIRQILQSCKRSAPCVPTLVRGQNGYINLLETAGRLWQADIDIDLGAINRRSGGSRVLTDLPSYPWHHDTSYWAESRLTREWRFRRFPHHELLGLRVTETGDAAPTWRNVLRVSDATWLRDHCVFGDVWFPASGFVVMVGEAVRQLSGSSSYSARCVTFASALILTNEPVEIITALVRIRKAGDRPGKAGGKMRYGFTVSSFSGDDSVTEHVYGECCAGRWENGDGDGGDDDHDEIQSLRENVQSFPRKVAVAPFYKLWNTHGLQYGPRFRGMSDVSTHLGETKAVATVQDQDNIAAEFKDAETDAAAAPDDVGRRTYSMHPATIDTCTTICMIAECHGLPRNFESIGIPTSMEEMYVASHHGPVRVVAHAHQDAGNSTITGVDGEGRHVLQIRGFRVERAGPEHGAADGGRIPRDDDPHGGAVLEWRADADFLTSRRLLAMRTSIRSDTVPMEEDLENSIPLPDGLLGILGFNNPQLRILDLRLGSSRRPRPNTRDALVSHMNGEGMYGTYVLAYTRDKHSEGSSGNDEDDHDVSEGSDDHAAGRVLHLDLASDLTEQSLTGGSFDLVVVTEVSVEKGLMAALDTAALRSLHRLLRHGGLFLLRHINLAIPGVKSLLNENSDNMISDSQSQISGEMKKALADAGFVDIATSLASSAELLVTSTIARACPSPLSKFRQMNTSSANSTTIDRPALRILCRDLESTNLSRAVNILQARGFSDVQLVTLGGRLSADDIDRVALCLLDIDGPFLYSASEAKFEGLKQSLSLSSAVQADDGDGSVIINSNGGVVGGGITPRNEFPSLLWVTGASQVDCSKDPNYALTLGFVRSLRRETGDDVVTLEVNSFFDLDDDEEGQQCDSLPKHAEKSTWDAVDTLLRSMPHRAETRRTREEMGGGLPLEIEYVQSEGLLKISRLRRINVVKELEAGELSRGRSTPNERGIECHQEGHSELGLKSGSRAQQINGEVVDPEPGWSVVEVQACKKYGEPEIQTEAMKTNDVGNESAHTAGGTVLKIGHDNDKAQLTVGDRIVFTEYALPLERGSKVHLPVTKCIRVPASLDLDEAVAVAEVFVPASYALNELGRSAKGQRVLVHNVESAVGYAALQVARAMELSVFVGVSDTARKEHLIRQSGFGLLADQVVMINNERIVSNGLRDGQFDLVIAIDERQGSILESLASQLVPFGAFAYVSDGIDDPDFDRTGHGIRQCLTFSTINYAQLVRHRSQVCARLLEDGFFLYERGEISFTPKDHAEEEPPVRVDSDNDEGRRKRLGRPNGVNPPSSLHKPSNITRDLAPKNFAVHADRTYILVGGLGGLGQSTARFLAERGARNFMFFSRSAERYMTEDPDFIKEMQAYENPSSVVRFFSGDVSREEDVRRMAQILSTWPPLGGVFNAAMVLEDAMLSDMTYSQWRAAVLPKVEGTWNLHRVLFASRLAGNTKKRVGQENRHTILAVADDAFLFLFSSLSGVAHMLGQANYAAANSFLDAFAQYHVHATRGLPSGVLDIGAMEDVGVLAREDVRMDRFRGQKGVRMLGERQFLEALELILGPWQRRRGEQLARTCSDVGCSPHIQEGDKEYVSSVQIVIGLGSPPPTGNPSSPSTGRRVIISGGSTGMAWDFDPRMAFYAAADDALLRRAQEHAKKSSSTGGHADDNDKGSSSEMRNKQRASRRDEALKQFFRRARGSSADEEGAGYLSSPEAAFCLADIIVRQIRELRGEEEEEEEDRRNDEHDNDDEGSRNENNGIGVQYKQQRGGTTTARSLASLGVDSLVTVELRTWVRQRLGVTTLTVAEIRRAKDVETLGGLVAAKMVAAACVGAGAGGS